MSDKEPTQNQQVVKNATEPVPEQAELEQKPQDEQQQLTLQSVVEAILFASDEPLEASKIAKVAGAGDARQVRKLVQELNAEYSRRGAAYRIEELAGGYVMLTLPEYNSWLKQLLQTRQESKLSQAALETLAIVAYKQPVMRVTVEALRGVAAGEMIRNLMEKGLVKIAGRAEELGRPLLYGTTRKFLEVFGLNSLQDLPKVEELRPREPTNTKADQTAVESDEPIDSTEAEQAPQAEPAE
ncbi:MAG: SMC-Scp complex subunit ScpB [Actinobacteria bacterium]|nr:SMC-Scp complex subunit ScpB [Actinomycetota bacterium]